MYEGDSHIGHIMNVFDVKVVDNGITNSDVKLTADNPTKVQLNSLYDPKITSNVSGLSDTDGDITKDVNVIFSNVDTSKVGTYTVSYKVTDSVEAVDYLTISVVVDNQSPLMLI
jgi:hypothetical protein